MTPTTNCVGIDVSKGYSTVAIRRPFDVVIAEPFTVLHTKPELTALNKRIRDLDGDTFAVMEATGGYQDPILQSLLSIDLPTYCVNPLLTSNYDNDSLRGVKTDPWDARKCANYGLEKRHKLIQYTPPTETRTLLKAVSRQFSFFQKWQTAVNNHFISLLDHTFPGVNELFTSPERDDGTVKWVDFSLNFWHVECVTTMSRQKFQKSYQTWCKRHKYYNVGADKVYDAAKIAVPTLPKTDAVKLMVQTCAKQLTFVAETVETFRRKMLALAETLPEFELVRTFYGCRSGTLGVQLMAEIGDVTRFANKRKLVAFAGVDVPPKDSGQRVSKSGKITKRGSPHIRHALFNVVNVYLMNSPPDEPVYQFLDKKRSEGKLWLVYMTAAANKFLRVYYAKVTEFLAAQPN